MEYAEEEGRGDAGGMAVGRVRCRVTKAAPRRSMPKRLSRVAMTSWSVALDLFGCMAYWADGDVVIFPLGIEAGA